MRTTTLTLPLLWCMLNCQQPHTPPRPTLPPTETSSNMNSPHDATVTPPSQRTPRVRNGPGWINMGQGQPSLPQQVRVTVHLPGSDPRRFVSATVTLGIGTESTIEGCVSAVANTCFATQRIVFTAQDYAAYMQLWNEIERMPRCEPLARFPGDRLFQITGPDIQFEDPLPADPSQIGQRTQGDCLAPARLAVWVARKMGGLP